MRTGRWFPVKTGIVWNSRADSVHWAGYSPFFFLSFPLLSSSYVPQLNTATKNKASSAFECLTALSDILLGTGCQIWIWGCLGSSAGAADAHPHVRLFPRNLVSDCHSTLTWGEKGSTKAHCVSQGQEHRVHATTARGNWFMEMFDVFI